MAKAKAPAAGKAAEKVPVRDIYPRTPIDRSFAAEASRRNIEVIIWYKRLINATLALLVAACFFTLIAVFFAWHQPMPKLFGTALDGGLHPIEYVRSTQDPRLNQMREGLTMEVVSRKDLPQKTPIAAPVTPAAPPATPVVASGSVASTPPSATAPTTIAPAK